MNHEKNDKNLKDWLKNQQSRYQFFFDPIMKRVVIKPKSSAFSGLPSSNL